MKRRTLILLFLLLAIESAKPVWAKTKAWMMEPGVVKTPLFAIMGWFTWSNMKPFMEGLVLLGTLTIVLMHASTAVARKYCPKRRSKGLCETCPLCRTFWCPAGLNKSDET